MLDLYEKEYRVLQNPPTLDQILNPVRKQKPKACQHVFFVEENACQAVPTNMWRSKYGIGELCGASEGSDGGWKFLIRFDDEHRERLDQILDDLPKLMRKAAKEDDEALEKQIAELKCEAVSELHKSMRTFKAEKLTAEPIDYDGFKFGHDGFMPKPEPLGKDRVHFAWDPDSPSNMLIRFDHIRFRERKTQRIRFRQMDERTINDTSGNCTIENIPTIEEYFQRCKAAMTKLFRYLEWVAKGKPGAKSADLVRPSDVPHHCRHCGSNGYPLAVADKDAYKNQAYTCNNCGGHDLTPMANKFQSDKPTKALKPIYERR